MKLIDYKRDGYNLSHCHLKEFHLWIQELLKNECDFYSAGLAVRDYAENGRSFKIDMFYIKFKNGVSIYGYDLEDIKQKYYLFRLCQEERV